MAKGKYDKWLEPDGLLLLEAWTRDGLTDDDIALKLGVNRTTLYDWKKKHPDISDALKRGKEVVDIEVENALFKRALGYKYTEVTRERVFNKENENYDFVVTKEVTKEVVPDTTAQIFWLKNRKPEQWRDKQIIESKENGRTFDRIIEAVKNIE